MNKKERKQELRFIEISLLVRRWRGYAKKKLRRARQRDPKDRERALKEFIQGGIYGICATHLEDALKQAKAANPK